MQLSSVPWKAAIAFALLPIFNSGCGGVGSKVARNLDDIKPPNPGKLAQGLAESGSITRHAIPSPELAESITNLIRVSGGPAGRTYVSNQVAAGLPISQKSLTEIVYDESLNELRKTGQMISEMQLRALWKDSIIYASAIISETTSNNSEVQVAE
jgi:hypothetical protein